MKPAVGVTIEGKYRLERQLGGGGMGTVWVARHLRLDVTVAVKVLRAVFTKEGEHCARFEREARRRERSWFAQRRDRVSSSSAVTGANGDNRATPGPDGAGSDLPRRSPGRTDRAPASAARPGRAPAGPEASWTGSVKPGRADLVPAPRSPGPRRGPGIPPTTGNLTRISPETPAPCRSRTPGPREPAYGFGKGHPLILPVTASSDHDVPVTHDRKGNRYAGHPMSVLNPAQENAVAELLRVSPSPTSGRRFGAAGHECIWSGVRCGTRCSADSATTSTSAPTRGPKTLAIVQGWADAIWETGREFGTIGVQKNGLRLEITTFRAEAYDGITRNPIVSVRQFAA